MRSLFAAILMLVSACAPIIRPTPASCIDTCYSVIVDNGSQYDMTIRINGAKYEVVTSYETAKFTFPANRLIQDDCAFASASSRLANIYLAAEGVCNIRPNQYLRITINTTATYVWLTPFSK